MADLEIRRKFMPPPLSIPGSITQTAPNPAFRGAGDAATGDFQSLFHLAALAMPRSVTFATRGSVVAA